MTWQDKIHGHAISKAELKLRIEVQNRDLHPDMSKDIILRWTRPDQYYEQTVHPQPLAVYLDTKATHKDPDRDDEITMMLEKRKITVFRYVYRAPIPTLQVRNIADEIETYVKGPKARVLA